MACSSSGSNYSSSLMGCGTPRSSCPDENGCISGLCPDLVVRQHDTKPPFKVKIEDCDGPLDLTDLVLEATMWANGKLKTALNTNHTVLGMADNIGFNQIMVGDIILIDQARLPEKMLVIGFDEENRLVNVQRGYHGTLVQNWKKGAGVKIIKFTNATATTEMIYQDILNIDGTTTQDVLTDSFFVYEWNDGDTCLPGCYWLEFKLMKLVAAPFALNMQSVVPSDQIPSNLIPSYVTPSFTDPSFTPATFNCDKNATIEWIRRFPVDSEGFYIKITSSITIND